MSFRSLFARVRLPHPGAARRGKPTFVNLRNMKATSPEKLGNCQLARSIAKCRYIGSGVIIYYLDPDKIILGDACELRDYSILEVGGRLEVGENSVIGAYNWLQASGTIMIGNDVLIGPHTAIISTSHTKPTVLVGQRHLPLRTGSVAIGDNAWIGSHVCVLMNVSVGKRTTIGAGSVVTRNIPADAVAFGKPCRATDKK
jgi:acetyltransferase-like isoleucine patch superfamily enzyme